jgi:hypothetical protein
METESEISLDDTASKINAFKKAREIEQAEFDVYVYRIIQDQNKKTRHPFLTKYQNYLPDELEIGEKFRGGRYKLQAIWYVNSKQKSESWSYEIDESSFPQKPFSNSIVSPPTNGDMSQNLMFLVADIVKTAYSNRPQFDTENNSPQRDPLELFGEVQNKMQEMYSRFMEIQSSVMERSFQMNLEKKFGITDNQSSETEVNEDAGFMESGVVEIVKQIVDGAKLILPMLGLPGAKNMVEGIKDNPMFAKYKKLAENPIVVSEVARALRKEYGDRKAGLLLDSFGIKMVARPGQNAVVQSVSRIDMKPANKGNAGKVTNKKKVSISGKKGKLQN